VNKERPHILVLPEDGANSQLANGFLLGVDLNRQRQMKVLAEAGGWRHVLHIFESDHIAEMNRYTHRFMILLIDFDGQQDRLADVLPIIPDNLTDRVFVLGTLTEPEDLKREERISYEAIGSKLAQDCREDIYTTWGHNLLQHNERELNRLRECVRSILF
jgi:hypothetical protein